MEKIPKHTHDMSHADSIIRDQKPDKDRTRIVILGELQMQCLNRHNLPSSNDSCSTPMIWTGHITACTRPHWKRCRNTHPRGFKE